MVGIICIIEWNRSELVYSDSEWSYEKGTISKLLLYFKIFLVFTQDFGVLCDSPLKLEVKVSAYRVGIKYTYFCLGLIT